MPAPPSPRRSSRSQSDRQLAAERLASLGAAGSAAFVPGRPQHTDQAAADLLASFRTGDRPDAPDGVEPPSDRLPAASDSWRARAADRLPLVLRGARWSAPLTAFVAVAALTALVAVVIAVRTASATPGVPVPVRPAAQTTTASPDAAATEATGTSAPSGSAARPATTSPSGGVVVHVVGQVGAPGVVRLPAGSRVDDALEAAGGATSEADLSRVNLARQVVDGEQVLVPRPGEEVPAVAAPGPAAPSGSAGAPAARGAAAGSPVDLNAATLPDLDALPGIGPVLAQRILEWRDQNGRFTSIDELAEVSGIGDRVLEQLRPLVRV